MLLGATGAASITCPHNTTMYPITLMSQAEFKTTHRKAAYPLYQWSSGLEHSSVSATSALAQSTSRLIAGLQKTNQPLIWIRSTAFCNIIQYKYYVQKSRTATGRQAPTPAWNCPYAGCTRYVRVVPLSIITPPVDERSKAAGVVTLTPRTAMFNNSTL